MTLERPLVNARRWTDRTSSRVLLTTPMTADVTLRSARVSEKKALEACNGGRPSTGARRRPLGARRLFVEPGHWRRGYGKAPTAAGAILEPPRLNRGRYASPSVGATNMQTTNNASMWLFLISFALVFYGMGASFVESFVNYPTWRVIGAQEFPAYHRALGPLVIGYMVIPMLITTMLTLCLLWFGPAVIPRGALWLSVVLQLMIWVSTAAVQLPIQVQLSRDGLSLPLIDRLIFTNWWLRKVPQMINALLFLWVMSLLLRATSPRSAESITTSRRS